MRARRDQPGSKDSALDALWAHHHAELRDPHHIVSQWESMPQVDPRLLRHTVRGQFWERLEATGGTLMVTREYEHLVLALSVTEGKRKVSYLRLPHPNGLAVDTARGRVYVASTRNPNLVLEFAPCRDFVPREAPSLPGGLEATLLPVSCLYFPGCLYIHDLALIGGRLYANAVGMNAVVELTAAGFRPVWWPRCIDRDGEPLFGRNYLQLNSIAAGKDLASSYFSASAAEPSARRPGHLNFPVDKRGVIFSGRTRDVVACGLTRPHSARLVGKTVWVDNSGYGEFGCIDRGRFEPIVKLRGWTRGLYIDDGVAFVGTSRVIPRFRHYAPGVDPDTSEAGVHAIDLRSGRVLGSLVWPMGNQIFAIEISKRFQNAGFPFSGAGRQNAQQVQQLYFNGSPFDRQTPPAIESSRPRFRKGGQ